MSGSQIPPQKGFDKLRYLESILSNVTDIINILDGAGIIRYVSPSLTDVLGYAPEELLGKSGFDLIHLDDYKRALNVFLETLPKQDVVVKIELRFKCKDGSWKYLESSGKNLLHDPQVQGIVISARDITERREAESKIRLQARTLEVASNGIVITDVRGIIIWVNKAFTKMTGYSSEEAIGQNPRILKSGEQDVRIYENLWKMLLSGEVWTGELINRRKDGTLYFERQVITPVKNDEGDIIYFIAIKEDITSDKKMEAQFQQAQKMETVGRLAGGVAHDFNNLLTIILGQSELLLEDLPENTKWLSRIKEIKDAGRRAAALTRQLLAFSRKQIFQSKVTDLNEIVRNADKMIRRLLGEDVEFVTLLGEKLSPVKVDASQMDQVIMNLVVNARDAMPQGGKLVVETLEMKVSESLAARYPGLPAGEYVVLKVQDSGIGMTKEVKAHLFEPFFTTKEKGKGTGLGLATVYGIVKQSLGYIYADSELGKGTSFLVFLPPSEEKISDFHSQSEKILPRGNETILVAEDEELMLMLITQILTRQGFHVLEARNGLDALRLLEDAKTPPIQMLLTDLVMPYMGGSELADKVSKKYPHIKIVFTSGYSDRSAIQEWLEKGHCFLQKPYMPAELLAAVRAELDKKKTDK